MIKIIGDIMLDEWIEGSISKNSPEAPVKIFDQLKTSFNLGGAGNVAANLKKLNSKIKLFSAVGKDLNGKRIIKLLRENKINHSLSQNLKITTTKTRLIINKKNKHFLRIDNEKKEENVFDFKNLSKNKKKKNIFLLIDYNKGIINKKLCNFLNNKNNYVFVDPKNKPELYKNCFLVKPNMKRLNVWLGKFSKKKCFKLLKKMKWKWLVVTDGANGVHIFNDNFQYKKFKFLTKSVKDVSGAGDTFMSVLVYYYSKGLNIFNAAELGCKGASKIVEKNKVVPIDLKDIFYNSVFTNGVFDILHEGHLELFKFCKKIGKKLIVGINSDKSVSDLKGPSRPFNKIKTRILNLKKIKEIDKIIVFNASTPIKLIKRLQPDVIVKGGDYQKKQVVGKKISDVIIFPRIKDLSTTKILKSKKIL